MLSRRENGMLIRKDHHRQANLKFREVSLTTLPPLVPAPPRPLHAGHLRPLAEHLVPAGGHQHGPGPVQTLPLRL